MNYLRSLLQLSSVFAVALLSVIPVYSHSALLAPLASLLSYFGSALLLCLGGSLLVTFAALPAHPVILLLGLLLLILYFVFYRISLFPLLTFFTWATAMVLFIYRICMLAIPVLRLGTAPDYSLHGYLLNLAICILLFLFGMLFFANRTEDLASNTNIQSSVWCIAVIISFIFILLNLIISFQSFRIMQHQSFLSFFLGYVLFTFFLYVMMCVVYVIIAEEYADNALLREEKRLQSVQDMQYETLLKEMQLQQEFRHDVKHTMATLRAMLEEKDLVGATDYIDKYTKDIPHASTKNFCPLPALNAVLNYYEAQARAMNASTSFQVYLPSRIEMEDQELCSLVGNILENALDALILIPEAERELKFSLLLKSDSSLFIVSTNTFSGAARKIGDRYVSTKRSSGGIGTRSMSSTVRKYGGTINLHHTDREFYVDIYIPVQLKSDKV